MALLKNFVVMILFLRKSEQECSIKTTSCAEIKTPEGFNFSHGFFRGSTVTAVRHQIPIAHGVLNPPSFTFTQDVRSMDSSSIVTKTCEDLRLEATFRHGRYIRESCVNFKVIECCVKNISCTEIKTAEGFNFSHGITGGSRVTAIRNQILIANGLLSPPSFNFTPDVRSMDNVSIVTTTCEDLTIQVTHHNGRHIRESCVEFRVNDKEKPPKGETTYLRYIIGGSVSAFVAVGLIIACLCYIRWKRKENVEEGDNGDLASQQDGSSDELENGQNENPPGIPHESVPIPIIDPEAGGGTAHVLCLNRNFSKGGIQPSTNGCISHSVVASGSNDQTVNQKMYSGRTCGGQSPEGHENEDEPLLLKPSCQEELYEPPPPPPHCRPAIQVSDMTGGEAVVWWTRHGSDPALTSRCSTAPDMDVDSAPDMKQN